MAQRSQVPKFGCWENADVPYTDYFEKASTSKSAKTISNKTSGSLDRSSNNLSTAQAPPVKSGSQKGQEAVRKKHVHSSSPEDGNLRRSSVSLPQHDSANRKVERGLPLHRDRSAISNDSPKRAIRQSVVSDCRSEHSPSPQNHQARVGGKGSGKSRPSLPRKSSTDSSKNLAPSTPGRTRMRSVTQGNGIRDHSAAVPKFGDWNESDPASADGFTDAFNRVREEKLSGNGMVSVATTPKEYKETPMRCCYFPWCK